MAPQPNNPASVELVKGPQATLSGVPTNGGATVAERPTSGLEGFIEGGFGSYGLKTVGGAVTIPLVDDKLHLRIEGYEARTGAR